MHGRARHRDARRPGRRRGRCEHQPESSTVNVQLPALNDFHGNLAPPSGSGGVIDGVPAGGAEFLVAQLATLRAENRGPNTITVAAGDLIGASPLLSAAFPDEPTLEALVPFTAEIEPATAG